MFNITVSMFFSMIRLIINLMEYMQGAPYFVINIKASGNYDWAEVSRLEKKQ